MEKSFILLMMAWFILAGVYFLISGKAVNKNLLWRALYYLFIIPALLSTVIGQLIIEVVDLIIGPKVPTIKSTA